MSPRFSLINLPSRYDEPAPESLLSGTETITATRCLPGFVFENVTYESHTFWLHHVAYARTASDCGILIRVRHGGGWEAWRGDKMLSRIFARIPDDHGAFWLCWSLADLERESRAAGYGLAADTFTKAFVDGRLRKRALPKQGRVKVWIEPAAAEPATKGVPA